MTSQRVFKVSKCLSQAARSLGVCMATRHANAALQTNSRVTTAYLRWREQGMCASAAPRQTRAVKLPAQS
jgi:hypothetical protein